ncbi:MAG TPA: hypothetical protein VIJ88_00940, partial [Candidatus Paceibacterota bacterium]
MLHSCQTKKYLSSPPEWGTTKEGHKMWRFSRFTNHVTAKKVIASLVIIVVIFGGVLIWRHLPAPSKPVAPINQQYAADFAEGIHLLREKMQQVITDENATRGVVNDH